VALETKSDRTLGGRNSRHRRVAARLASPVESKHSAIIPADCEAPTARQVIDRFMQNWVPFATLPPGSRARTSIARFLAASSAEDRARALEYASTQSRLQRTYQELGILRTDRAFDPYSELLELTPQKMAEAIQGNKAREILTLLQHAFEFGRHPALPQQLAARTFLLEFWALSVGGPNMKYCIYANGVPYSGGGKTHEEIAREFVSEGLGNGQPQCGGLIERSGALAFTFDISSTVFRGSVRPDGVRHTFLRAVRATGADETQLTVRYHG